MSVRISVIIPSWNQGEFIENAILSVLKQDYANWELIIQDGASKDATKEICERYARMDNRVQFCSEPDSGYAEAVNRALSRSSGEMVGIQSSDDFYSHASVFSQLVETLNRFPNTDVITGRYIDTDSHLREIPAPYKFPESGFLLPEVIYAGYYQCEQSATFFNPRRALEVGGMDANLDFCADIDLWIRMATFKPVSITAVFLVPYIWGVRVLHDKQRGSDFSKFYMANARMWVKHWKDSDLDLSEELKFNTASEAVRIAIAQLNALGRDNTSIATLYKSLHGGRLPRKAIVESYLSKYKMFRRIYYRRHRQNADVEKILKYPPGYCVKWF